MHHHVSDPSGTNTEDTAKSVGAEGGRGEEVNMKFAVHARSRSKHETPSSFNPAPCAPQKTEKRFVQKVSVFGNNMASQIIEEIIEDGIEDDHFFSTPNVPAQRALSDRV